MFFPRSAIDCADTIIYTVDTEFIVAQSDYWTMFLVSSDNRVIASFHITLIQDPPIADIWNSDAPMSPWNFTKRIKQHLIDDIADDVGGKDENGRKKRKYRIEAHDGIRHISWGYAKYVVQAKEQ